MEYNYLRGTGLKVSRACIGTMTFGSRLNQQEVNDVVDYAIKEGVNFFDTADMYTDGHSEIMLGKALGARRKDVIVASKVGFPVKPQTEYSLSRKRIMQAIDASLLRLNTDYLDLYYLHQPDSSTPFEESVETVSGLVKTGKIRYWGLSNYAAWQFGDAIGMCERNRWVSPVVIESTYNAITRGAEQELVPFLMEKKRGMTVFNPLAGGMLTGKHKPGEPTGGTRFENNPNYQRRYWRDDNFKAIQALANLAEAENTSILEISLRWCVSRPWVNSVILGFSSKEQFEINMKAVQKGPIDEGLLESFDKIWEMVSGGRVPYNR